MRVMQVDVNYDFSSTGKIVRDLRTGLVNRGHQAIAIYGRGPTSTQPGTLKVASAAEVLFHAGMTRITGVTGCFSPLATRRLKRAIEAYNPDIVHLHELHGYYVNILDTLQFLRSRAIPIVWTFHCEFMYTGKCGYSHDCERWKTGCHNCPQLKVYPASMYFDFTKQMYERKRAAFESLERLRIVTPSTWLAGRVYKSFLANREIDVIYNGVNTTDIFFPRDKFAARARLGTTTKHVVVSVAPNLMTPIKGGHWILELAQRMSTKDVTFVMVGVDPSFDIRLPNVIALPRTSDQHFLAEIYSAGDFFLLTSEKETFSLVTSEALACGTPVIGFDCGAPLEVAPHGYGHWVKYGELDELERVLGGVLDGSLDVNSREKCREFAENMYSQQRMVDQYLSVYEELLQ